LAPGGVRSFSFTVWTLSVPLPALWQSVLPPPKKCVEVRMSAYRATGRLSRHARAAAISCWAKRGQEGVKKSNRLLVKSHGRTNPGGSVLEVSASCNAGTAETFPRRLCAEMFRLSPYCPERPIRTAAFRSRHKLQCGD